MSNAYCQLSDLAARYDIRQANQLSNDINDPINPNATNQQAALDDVASQLDSYLMNRVTIPWDVTIPVPQILTRYVASHAFERLYGRRGDAPDSVGRDVKETDKWLEDFCAGVTMLPGTSRAVPALVESDSFHGRSITDGVDYFPGRPLGWCPTDCQS